MKVEEHIPNKSLTLVWDPEAGKPGRKDIVSAVISKQSINVTYKNGKEKTFGIDRELEITTGKDIDKYDMAELAFHQQMNAVPLNLMLLDEQQRTTTLTLPFFSHETSDDALSTMLDIATIAGFSKFDVRYYDRLILDVKFSRHAKHTISDANIEELLRTPIIPSLQETNTTDWTITEERSDFISLERQASSSSSIWGIIMVTLFAVVVLLMLALFAEKGNSMDGARQIKLVLILVVLGLSMAAAYSHMKGSAYKGYLAIDKKKNEVSLMVQDQLVTLPVLAIRGFGVSFHSLTSSGSSTYTFGVNLSIAVGDQHSEDIQTVDCMNPLWKKGKPLSSELVLKTQQMLCFVEQNVTEMQRQLIDELTADTNKPEKPSAAALASMAE